MESKFAFLIFAYFLASVPFGLLVGLLFYRRDIRTLGSGNIGATNVWRTCGKTAGIATFMLDGLKGALPVLVAQKFFPGNFFYVVAIFCILGNIFSVFLKFRGGKAVAMTIFLLFATNWILGISAVFVWVVFLLLFGISSLSALMMPIFIFPMSAYMSLSSGVLNWQMLLFNIFLLAVIWWKHRGNISRLRLGEEGLMFKRALFRGIYGA